MSIHPFSFVFFFSVVLRSKKERNHNQKKLVKFFDISDLLVWNWLLARGYTNEQICKAKNANSIFTSSLRSILIPLWGGGGIWFILIKIIAVWTTPSYQGEHNVGF